MEIKEAKKNERKEVGCDFIINGQCSWPQSVPFNILGKSSLDINMQIRDTRGSPSVLNNHSGPPATVNTDVLCLYVENAVSFYGCLLSRVEALNDIMRKINSICRNLSGFSKKPPAGKVYACFCNEDNTWYRCTILHNIPGKCLVQYVDHGKIDEVPYHNIVELSEPLKNISPLSVKCILSDFVSSQLSFSQRTYLQSLQNQRLNLVAIPSVGDSGFQVIRCYCNGIDVINELVSKGLAIPKMQSSFKKNIAIKSPTLVPEPACCDLRNGNSKNFRVDWKKTCSETSEKPSCNDIEGKFLANGDMKSCIRNNESQRNQVLLDFCPKRIIKRGTDIEGRTLLPRAASPTLDMRKIDAVFDNVKLIRSLRSLINLNDDLVMQNAVGLLQSNMNVMPHGSTSSVDEMYEDYRAILQEIKDCSDKVTLENLKNKRQNYNLELCTELQILLETYDKSAFNKQDAIQETIIQLGSNVNAWMNIHFPREPTDINDFLSLYHEEKNKLSSSLIKARCNTDRSHKELIQTLDLMKQDLILNVVDENSNTSHLLPNSDGEKVSWSVRLEDALSNLCCAVDEEMRISSETKKKNCTSAMKYILNQLDIPKEKIDLECESYSRYSTLYEDLCRFSDISSNFEEFDTVQKTIVSWQLSSKENSEDFREIHSAMLKEESLTETFTKASEFHFPELNVEHPELNLNVYQQYKCLMKPTWKKEYFPIIKECERIEPSFLSKLGQEAVAIKEFSFKKEDDMKHFLTKAIMWNEMPSKSVCKVRALFQKGLTVSAVMSSTWKPLSCASLPLDFKQASLILQKILLGLRDLHAKSLTHDAVHPQGILYSDGHVLLDLNYDLKPLDETKFNGMKFHVASEDFHKSADMYGFGCLVLWLFFPNFSFTYTEEGIPHISAFQSICEGVFTPTDYEFLCALINPIPDLRPSSSKLLSSSFLKSLRSTPDIQ